MTVVCGVKDVPWKPVYLSGMPPVRVTYSTLHKCTLPLLLPLAML